MTTITPNQTDPSEQSRTRRSVRASRARLATTVAPFGFALIMLVALFVIPLLAGREASTFSVYNAMQSYSGLGLVALALGLTMIIGEFDLSVVGTYALAGMIAVKTGADQPLVGIAYALIVCGGIGLVQGLLIARLGVNSMAITLGGYLAAIGLTGTIGDDKSQAFANFEFSGRLNEPIAQVFSLRSIVTLVVVAVVIAVIMATRIGRDMRAAGGGRRASRTAGVRVELIVVATFTGAGLLAGLGGTLQSYGVATAATNPGLSPLIFAITATLLGGIALSGGKGTPLGIVAGSIGLCFFAELFTTLATPQYVVSLLTGGLLVAVTLLTTEPARRGLAALRRHLPGSPSATA